MRTPYRMWIVMLALPLIANTAFADQDASVVKVEYRDADAIFATEAVVEAVRQSTIAARITGRIVELRVDVGDVVKAGEVVARIDAREASQVVATNAAQVAQARAALENARANLERSRALLAQNFVSQASVDQADAQYKAAVAQMRAAEAGVGQASIAKGYTTVVAPFSGVVSARHVEVGEMAVPGRDLFTTFGPKDMRVIAEIPQSRLRDVKAYSKAVVEIPSQGKWINVRSLLIVPSADPRTHSTRIRLQLPADSENVYPGIYARAHFAIGRAKKLVVPTQSIVRRSEVSGVFVVNDQGAKTFRQIRIGEPAGAGWMEVLAGVMPGEKVAIDPIKAGMAAPVNKRSGS